MLEMLDNVMEGLQYSRKYPISERLCLEGSVEAFYKEKVLKENLINSRIRHQKAPSFVIFILIIVKHRLHVWLQGGVLGGGAGGGQGPGHQGEGEAAAEDRHVQGQELNLSQ